MSGQRAPNGRPVMRHGAAAKAGGSHLEGIEEGGKLDPSLLTEHESLAHTHQMERGEHVRDHLA